MRLLGNILAVDRPPYSAILSLTAHDPSLLVRAVGASLTITTRLRLFVVAQRRRKHVLQVSGAVSRWKILSR